ncbi:Phosphoribosylglycinamide formyltransferase [hydrothermal vent metagenome]|uniref:phosphoribosylglycinamide formyltransferase 1 n=1 Tax=hydrothermal vent metagenome TaxID=652676 RepID=A0A3B0VG74_9ZZZZ
MSSSFNIAVFISGTGSNLSSIINQQAAHNYNVAVVISNKTDAKGLKYAKAANIPYFTFTWDKHDEDLIIVQNQIRKYNCDLIVLAGFMKILPAAFTQTFANKIINIHPSLLPKYPGLHTHERVIANNDSTHGATVHYVNTQLDAGAIISQTKFAVSDNASPESLAAQLLCREHALFPHTIALIAQNRVKWCADKLYFDHEILTKPIIFDD